MVVLVDVEILKVEVAGMTMTAEVDLQIEDQTINPEILAKENPVVLEENVESVSNFINTIYKPQFKQIEVFFG